MWNYFKEILKDKSFIILLISYLVFIVFISLGHLEFQVSWITDYNIWINEFINNFLIYALSLILLKRIKKNHIREFISFVLAIFLSNFLIFNFSNIQLNWVYIGIELFLYALILIFSALKGFEDGQFSAYKEINQISKEFYNSVNNSSAQFKCLVYNCKKILKKYPKEIELINTYGEDFIYLFIEENKKIQNNKK